MKIFPSQRESEDRKARRKEKEEKLKPKTTTQNVPALYGDKLPFDVFNDLKAWDSSLYTGIVPECRPLEVGDDEIAHAAEVGRIEKLKNAKKKFDFYVSIELKSFYSKCFPLMSDHVTFTFTILLFYWI